MLEVFSRKANEHSNCFARFCAKGSEIAWTSNVEGPFLGKDGKNVFYLEKSMLFATKMLQNAKRLPTSQKKAWECYW